MGKTAFLFPGQGSQKVGMCQQICTTNTIASQTFTNINNAVDVDLNHLCFEENEDINKTEYTQVALVAVECAVLAALEQRGIKADVTAGLSLGEYSALVASKAISAEDAAKVVRQRGIFMEQEVPNGKGAMAAILALDADKIEETIKDIEGVSIANYNCPGQVVISGEKQAVEIACEKLKEAGCRRAIMLNVSGPFHSAMLKGAGDKLSNVLADVSVHNPQIPYVANVNAQYVSDSEQIKPYLIKQVSSSVRFEQSIRAMLEDGVDTFIEIGPGKTLSGFVKKISREVNIFSVESPEDIDQVAEFFA